MWSEAEVSRAATQACRLEASAEKPGNVTPRHAFPDMEHRHFMASAEAIGPVMGAAGRRRVGETVLRAVEATRRVTRANTNLGTILLLAPLARAALRSRGMTQSLREARSLRERLRATLADLDREDAKLAYRAILLAAPGGMGRVAEQDLAEEPTATLLDAMRLAADRDVIAREYATDFSLTFESAVPLLERALADGLGWEEAAVELFLGLLSRTPDTLIERKFGSESAADVSARAAAALASGEPRSPGRTRAVEELDAWLRDPARRWNPGATADLVAAALFVRLLTGRPASAIVAVSPTSSRGAEQPQLSPS